MRWGIWGMRVRALCFRHQRRKIGEFFVEKSCSKLMSKKYVWLFQRRKKAGKVFGLSRLVSSKKTQIQTYLFQYKGDKNCVKWNAMSKSVALAFKSMAIHLEVWTYHKNIRILR